MSKRTQLPPPSFIARDVEIFNDIYTRRGLTAYQITALYYPIDAPAESRVFPILKRNPSCQDRLLKFFQHGYIERHEQPERRSLGTKDYVNTLSRKGVRLLGEWLGRTPSELPYYTYAKDSKERFFEHLVARNDFWVALRLAAPKNNARIVTWHPEMYFKRTPLKVPPATTTGKERHLQPDDYFHLQTDSNYYRFVEIDRGTETGISERYKSWRNKMELYVSYFESGAYGRDFGVKSGALLTVTTSEKRLQNLMRATEKAGGEGRFWFTTFDKVNSETVLTDKIWQIAGYPEEVRSIIW